MSSGSPGKCPGPQWALVRQSDTQWYKNAVKHPTIRIDTRGEEAELRAVQITETEGVKSVVDKFRDKLGAKDVKKYLTFDVAVVTELIGQQPSVHPADAANCVYKED